VPPEVDRALAEIRRVLRPGGLLFTTFLSTRHARFGHGIEIAPNTFVIEGHEERAHPHYYCDAPAVLRHLSGFALWSLADRVHEWPATYHWHALAERLPDPPLSRPA
jgi:SAM-dependent methyltransferase